MVFIILKSVEISGRTFLEDIDRIGNHYGQKIEYSPQQAAIDAYKTSSELYVLYTRIAQLLCLEPKRFYDPSITYSFTDEKIPFPGGSSGGESKYLCPGIKSTYARLQVPSLDEGFDSLYYVSLNEGNKFTVEEFINEV
ncbi:MAG: hypothetical protein ACYDEQ_06780 [Desulfocucumaceae bacterium]